MNTPGAVSERVVVGEEVVRARAGLLRVCEPPAPAVAELVARVGSVAAWEQIRSGMVSGRVGVETGARTEGVSAIELQELVEADLAAAAGVGAWLLVPEDPGWPAELSVGFRMATGRGVRGAGEPLALWVRGAALDDLPGRGVAVVGSRACTAYGQRVAAELALGLAEADRTVVSGAAFGVDAAAHRAALAGPGGRPTVAVLACGIDRAYPAANTGLLEAIAGRGAVVSEYPPGTSPARHRFLVRNRLIAALARGVVVVEAGRRSGTLSTAAAARHLNRVVMAVPGPVTSALSVGCHNLITAEQAVLVTGTADVLAQLWPADPAGALFATEPADSPGAANPPTVAVATPGVAVPSGVAAPSDAAAPAGVGPAAPAAAAGPAVSSTPAGDELSAHTSRVFDALPLRGGRSIVELARSTAVPARSVLAALAMLDLDGLATHTATGWRRTHTGGQAAGRR